MLKGLINKVVGDPNEREIQKLQPLIDAINESEPDMERRTEAELSALTHQFRARLAGGETLDDCLVEAFAAAREVAKRTVDMRPFDVQLVGGIVLHQGKVAEMRTGEGKTLVATMPIYLNALTGRGVHLVTVNDYLARRDALWMGPIYDLLGLSVGLLQSGQEQPAYLYEPSYQREPYPGLRRVHRREAYNADITYGTNNEFGFDYLRDNLALTLEGRVQRPLYYAIVDEVDNIFIDEARTPLIISGRSGEGVEDYSRFAAIARKLEPEVHFELDDKERSVFLTDEGLAVVEQETGIENIYDEANYRYVHYMQQALKAQVLFQEGREYIRQRKQIILVDQHTGRLMPSRRLSEGLHQAIEAKEGVPIRPRDVTSATITIQNYFRMYKKLAGMSGTALTEAEEFFKIYTLETTSIPTNKPVVRADHADVVYRSEEAKQRAVVRELLGCHSRGQPVLVGTTSVEMSEQLSKRLSGERIQMAVLSSRVAYALQNAELEREERDSLRETMNGSLETMNSAAWRKMVRRLGLNPNALAPENLTWAAEHMELAGPREAERTLERALREGIPHQVLNAKEHTSEASIIAKAGEPGAVTIATNMAGRGVDVKLGGELSDEMIHQAHEVLRSRGLDPFNATPAQMDSAIAEVIPQYARRHEQALHAGGLHVLGTERHEARRIDNQLRGRSGRQGEPGSSRFYLSLEDDLMRRFGRKEMLAKLMEQIGDDFPIEHGLVSRTIERAQTSVEGYNFDIRKHLLEYDDVLNLQRDTIYGERLRYQQSDDLRPDIWQMLLMQVDDYLEKHQDPDQRGMLFAGLDDVLPLIWPERDWVRADRKIEFRGPLAFGDHGTAFPPFSISFLAEQLADQPLEDVQHALQDLTRQSARIYGQQAQDSLAEIFATATERYDEQVERYQALLDDKIESYLELLQERGQPLDPRRLAQHLERTYPLRLTIPRDVLQLDLEDLRELWEAQVKDRYHQLTCAGLIDRAQVRLPAGVRLDRLRPARIPSAKLADELQRVLKMAVRQPRDEEAGRRLDGLSVPADPDLAWVSEFISTLKETSRLDFGRMDRLVGHVVGTELEQLLDLYLEEVPEEEGRIRRDLERLKDSLVEGKKGGRSIQLLDALRELNDLVRLEISDLARLLSLAMGHEYDKWAQRQVAEIEDEARRAPLADSSWGSVAEFMLATHYTQRQVYDRGHRRRAAWLPRLPFTLMAQAHVAGFEADTLREEITASLRWALELREQTWGARELQRLAHLSVGGLDEETFASLAHYLGKRQLGDLQEQAVEDLPPDLYEQLNFVLAMRQLEDRDLVLSELPHSDAVLDNMANRSEARVLDTPVGGLDEKLQQRIGEHLRQTGFLIDESARARLVQQPVENWDARTRREVSDLLGRQFIEEQKAQSVDGLPAPYAETTIGYLNSQRRFVDEEAVQRFLVHQGLADLPPETQDSAVSGLARTWLDRLSRRKISNLDVGTRQVVIDSLQQQGLFTDLAKRDELLASATSLADLDSTVRNGFGAHLAQERMDGRGLAELDSDSHGYVLGYLKENDLLADPQRAEALPSRRLAELEGELGSQIGSEVVAQLQQDLTTETMEELPASTRRLVHKVLDENDYFVDAEKAGWYERKTLALLPREQLIGLEERLGEIRLAEIEDTPFRSLPAETQDVVLTFLDRERLLAGRAERLRLAQTGSLSKLPQKTLDKVAQHLGRQWLVQIRDQRPPALPDREREIVWAYLRDQGYFADEFKEELFTYQRLEEFDGEIQQAVERGLAERVSALLDTQPIGGLPPDLQDSITEKLRQADYFVDPSLLHQVEESPLEGLPDGLRRGVEGALGTFLLTDLAAMPISDLPDEIQADLWRYLDEIAFFVDEQKRSQVLERRLDDLGSVTYDRIVADYAEQLREVENVPVAELDDALRQGLRETLEELGYFESAEVRAQVLGQSLGGLRREDLNALAQQYGHIQLDAWAGRSLGTLPAAESDTILSHLGSRDWFLDGTRYDRIMAGQVSDLEPKVRQELVESLRQQEIEHLSQQRLASLDRGQRHAVDSVLREEGLAFDESQMRSLQRQPLNQVDPAVYRRLLENLGSQMVIDWGSVQFLDLDAEQQAQVSAYLGWQIMSGIERQALLHTISGLWIDYLTDIEDLRRGIGLEAYGQRDPLVEYKRRASELFGDLRDDIRRTVVRRLFRWPPQPLSLA